jgi:hypothetical protein
MLRIRTFDAMGIAADQALAKMNKLADRYLEAVEPEAQKKIAAEITEALKAYAAENRLEYHETPPMTQNELFSSTSESIGAAIEPSPNPFQRGNAVAEEAFNGDTLYYPRRADGATDKRYVYWKTADQPPRTPEFKEVREKVVEAWKLDQARPRAKQRAEELAKLIQSSGKPPAEALSGQTVTGTTDSEAVTIRETPRFSWLNMPQSMPFQFNPMFSPPPQLSPVEGVEGAGQAFMKTVFEDLEVGDVGVAVNQNRSVFYVTRVKQRDAAPTQGEENLGLKALQQQFLITGRASAPGQFGFGQGPYFYLNRERLGSVFTEWRRQYEARYEVQWSTAAEEADASE